MKSLLLVRLFFEIGEYDRKKDGSLSRYYFCEGTFFFVGS